MDTGPDVIELCKLGWVRIFVNLEMKMLQQYHAHLPIARCLCDVVDARPRSERCQRCPEEA